MGIPSTSCAWCIGMEIATCVFDKPEICSGLIFGKLNRFKFDLRRVRDKIYVETLLKVQQNIF